MKRLATIAGALAAVCLTACAQEKTATMEQQNNQESKAVVVYFSATGTTKSEAALVAEAEGAPLLEIQPVEPYTSADLNWHNTQSRSSVEMADDSSRPAIKPMNADFSACDTVFLGYPIWWDLAPRVVNTFIEGAGLNVKTVIPFATSGGSGIDNSVRQLKKQYPDINWAKGRLLNGASEKTVDNWVESLGK